MDKSEHYTKFPNDILEGLYKYHFSALQIEIILYIVRKVEGYRKTKDTIAISKMARDMKRTRERTSNAVKKLEQMNVLDVKRTGNKAGNIMRVKRVSEWRLPVTMKAHVTKKAHVTTRSRDLCPDGHTTCDSAGTHKRNYTKENITKETPYIPHDEKEGFADRPFGEMYTPEEEERLRAEGWT